jgi:hypothetical protein
MKTLYFLLLLPVFVFSQTNYYTFKYNEKFGIASDKGEITKEAIYDDLEEFNTIDNFSILKNGNKTTVFNLINAESKEYDEYLPNEVFIENEYYALVKNNKTQFLLGQESGLIINLKSKVLDIENIGVNYIIARIETPIAKPKKLKSGLLLPKPIDNLTYYQIYKNTKKFEYLKQITSIELPLIDDFYAVDKNPGIVKMIEPREFKIKPWHHFLDNQFDYFTIKNKITFDLYNKDFILLQTIKFNELNYDSKVQSAIKLIEKNQNIQVYNTSLDFGPDVMDIGDPTPTFLKNIPENDLNILSYDHNGIYDFLFKTTSKIEFLSKHEIRLIDKNGNKVELLIDEVTPNIDLPKKLIEQFEISFSK